MTPAMATYCTTPIPNNATITVVSAVPGAPIGATGACPVKQADVDNPVNLKCSSQGEWTGIQYATTGLAASDKIATLVTANNIVAPNQILLYPGGYVPYSPGPRAAAAATPTPASASTRATSRLSR